MAQIFSDCAITKYLSRATVRPPNNSSCGESLQLLLYCGQYSLLNYPGLQGTPAGCRRSPRRSPTTVASPDGQYPGTCSGDSVDRQNDGAPVLFAVACLLAVLTYGEALSDRIVSYRVPYGCIVPSLVGTGMLDIGYAVRSGVNADLLLYR